MAPPEQQLAPWFFRPFPRPDAAARLYCFHHAGVGASCFHSWGREVEADVEVCAIQLPGREGRRTEAPCTRLADLVDRLVPVLADHIDRPFAFFGHSLGALVSFEVARALRCSAPGLYPYVQIVSSFRAPHVPDAHPPMHVMSDEQLVAELKRRYDGIPAILEEHPDLLALFLPVLRADVALIETYQYREERPFDWPLLVLGGRQDTHVPESVLQGWSEHTSAGHDVRMLDGGHFYIQESRSALLGILRQTLRGYAPARRTR